MALVPSNLNGVVWQCLFDDGLLVCTVQTH